MADMVRIGGLMRCCTGTLQDHYTSNPDYQAKEGDTMKCNWCTSGWMRFHAGAWEWDQEESRKAEKAT